MFGSRYLCAVVVAGLLGQPVCAYAWRLESAQVTTNDTSTTSSFTSVTFQETFDVIPIVVGVATDEGAEPAALRIRNVTTSGFEVAALEPTNSDGVHPGMTIDYVAIEPGTHKLPDGTEIAAGTHTTASVLSKFLPSTWDTVSFDTTLDANASVVVAIQTMNSEVGALANTISSPFMAVAARNASTTSVQLGLDRAETTTGTVVAEDIGWIAFPSGYSGTFLDTLDATIGWDARSTSDSLVGWLNGGCRTFAFSATSWPSARVISSQSSRDGGDGGWLRRCAISGTNVGLVIDEDTATDPDRAHTTETAALLSFSDSFHASFEGKVLANKTVSTPPSSYSLPGNIVTYAISVQSTGVLPIDSGTVVLVDALPPEVSLRIVDLDGPASGPINFSDGSPASGLSYTFLGLANLTDDLEFSNDGGATFGYVPTDDGSGADPNVTHIRISPKGTFTARSAAGIPNFKIEFDAVIK